MLPLGASLLFLGGFNLADLAGQLLVRGQQFAESDESADDENVHLHGAFAVQDGREHGHAVFSEGVRQVAPAAVP